MALFIATFANLDDWTVDDGTAYWSASAGILTYNNGGSGRNAYSKIRATGFTADGNDNFASASFVKSTDDYQGPGPGVRLGAGTGLANIDGYCAIAYADAFYLIRLDNGGETSLGSSTLDAPGQVVNGLQIRASGSTIVMSVAGDDDVSTTDATYASGDVGIVIGDFSVATTSINSFIAGDLSNLFQSQISVSEDDGWWREGGSFNIRTPHLEFGDNSGTDQNAYLRWPSVAVPAGATIEYARVLVEPRSNYTVAMSVRVQAVDEDDPTAPTNSTDADGRTLTTAYADWTLGTWATRADQPTPDLSAVVQEVIDRAGWASGQAMIVYLQNNSASGKLRRINSVEETDRAPNGAVLEVFYTESAGSTYDLTSSVTAATVTPDDATLGVAYSLASSVTAATTTPDDATLSTGLPMSAQVTAATVTPDDATLSIGHSLAAAVTAATATPDSATLSTDLSLSAQVAAATSTPDSGALFLGDYALRFYGNDGGLGVNTDRVQIPLESGASPTAVDVGGNFTYELWINCLYADNASSGIADARESNVLLDRDIWGDPLGWVLGVTRSGSDLVACFGLAGGSGTWSTIYGTTDIGDGEWHHIALVRTQSTGEVRIYVDGASDASGTYTTGDLSFAASGGGGGSPNGSDPYLVIGAEKHDANTSLYLSYDGYVDEFRVSDVARYTAGFTPPSAAFSVDGDTVSLYRFDDGAGTVLTEIVNGVDGALLIDGGGPTWELSTLWVTPTLFSAVIAGASSTPNGAVLGVARDLSATITATSTTTDDAVFGVVRSMAATTAATSATPDDAVLLVGAGFAASIAGTSTTPNDPVLEVLRGIEAQIAGASLTPNDAVVAVVRGMTSTIAGTSATPDEAVLLVGAGFMASMTGTSVTPDDALLGIARELIAVAAGASLTPDDAIFGIARAIAAVITGASSTPNDATLYVGTGLSVSMSASSVTPDDVTLGIAIVTDVVIASASSTPDDAVLGLLRRLNATTAGTSVTPDDAVLLTGLIFTAALSATSNTPDNAALGVARALTSITAGTSITPDEATLGIARTVAATITGASSTPDDAAFGIGFLVTAVIQALSISPDSAVLNIEIATGAVYVSFSGRKAAVSFSARKPSVDFSN